MDCGPRLWQISKSKSSEPVSWLAGYKKPTYHDSYSDLPRRNANEHAKDAKSAKDKTGENKVYRIDRTGFWERPTRKGR